MDKVGLGGVIRLTEWRNWSGFVKLISVVVLVLSEPATGWSQNVQNQFRFEHVTVNEGLSHSDAMCVAQDTLGFLWIGTNKGIDRFDGYNLYHYSPPVNRLVGLAGHRVRAMHVDRSNRLWAGIEGAGLIWYDSGRDRFLNVQTLSDDTAWLPLLEQLSRTSVLSLVSDSKNQLWVATQQAGLFRLRFNERGRLHTVERMPLIGTAGEAIFVNKLVVDQQDRIWIGTLGYGLWRVDARAGATAAPRPVRVTALNVYSIRALHLDTQGNLWIGTDYQVFWHGNRHVPTAPASSFIPLRQNFAHVESLFLDSFSRLWIGTNFGLLLMEPGPATSATPPVDERQVRTFLPLDEDPASISSVRIHDIVEDRFHNLWLAASAGGLNRLNLRAKPFMLIRRQATGATSTANNYINTICQERNSNRLWMGTRNGLTSYDLVQKTYRNYLSQALSGTVNGVDVSAIMQATDGTLWIGTRYGGLLTMNGQQPTSLRYLSGKPGQPDWSGLSIESMAEDRHGTIWIATLSAMYAFDQRGNYLRTVEKLGRLPVPQLTALLYDSEQDVLWASSRDAGLLKLRPAAGDLRVLAHYKNEPGKANSLFTNYVWPLLKDKRGILWIGTIGGGLHRLVTLPNGQERIERYKQWVPETDVESLLADRAGSLWIGGSGLYQFNPASKRLLHYDVSDGLQSNSFKVGAAFQASDGMLYFGGINGVTYFQPGTIRPNQNLPLVQLTGLRIFNQPVGVGDTLNGRVLLPGALSTPQTIVLKASENDFSIEFVGLNYANPRKQQYAYRLIGYNEAWIRTSSDRRVANFTNLPPGDYTFLVKASNDDGVWSARPASLQFTILPPWWKTWWAYLTYAIIIGGGLALYRRSELAQQALKNRLALEQFKTEKEKEITDMKVQFFTNVSHELRTPLTLILGPVEELSAASGPIQQVRDKIRLVHQQTYKLLHLVNQLMDFRKLESGPVALRASCENVIPFLTEIFLIFNLKADELQFEYTLQLPSEPIFLYFDRSKLEIILTNLLSNAFKYTPTRGRIRVEVAVVGTSTEAAVIRDTHLLDNYLQLTVRDWGVGMKPQDVEKIFDPYYQASHTETMQVMGTGIGLSLVRQYTLAHAGEVFVDSELGSGTTFTIRLPFGRLHLTAESIQSTAPQTISVAETVQDEHDTADTDFVPQLPVASVSRILVVEDNNELRQYIRQTLAPPFEVILAEDGVDGWEKTLEHVPDLIVTDVMMPRSNGLELCKKIKQHPKTMHIPVVLLTARTAAIYELEGLETGADEYMVKPFTPQLLQTKIATIIHTRLQLRTYYQRQLLLQPTEVVIPVKEKKLLESAISVVEANLTNPAFSIPILVRELGTSQSVLYKQIKAITGQSLIEFVRDIRLKRAAQLLVGSDMKIVDIARQVGFEDSKYFRKSFQNLYAITPSEYAKQYRASRQAVDEL